MQKLFIERNASDNVYLHRDFHIVLDQGLAYLGAVYGGSAVDEYLRGFTAEFYAPLVADINRHGLSALRAHIAKAYEAEEASDDIYFAETEHELTVSVRKCPAISHMHSAGHTPSQWFIKTTQTVYETIAARSKLGFVLLEYDQDTGAAKYRFTERVDKEGGI